MLKASHRRDLDAFHINIGMVFSRFGISPNAWTLLSLIPAIAGLCFMVWGWLAAGLVAFFISAFIDIIDGNVARVTKSVSSFGAFMDGVIDRYVELLLYLGIFAYVGSGSYLFFPNGMWIVLLAFSAIMPSFITSYADHRKVICDDETLRNMGGIMERFERLAFIYLGMLAEIWMDGSLMISVILVVILSNVTAIQRISKVVSNT